MLSHTDEVTDIESTNVTESEPVHAYNMDGEDGTVFSDYILNVEIEKIAVNKTSKDDPGISKSK
ncbi:hypothetical protein C0995_015220, partial [Termitomyces sp. Mi166